MEYLVARRWPDGIVCPSYKCKSESIHTWPDGKYYECRKCKKVFTVRTGTVFERSHVPLHKWLFTMYLMHIHRKGISSVQLAKEIGVTQKTAWFMLHRLREACEDESTYKQFTGVVEVDETYLGGKFTNREHKPSRGRGVVDKQPVVGVRQRGGKVSIFAVPDTTKSELQDAIFIRTADGATVYTDQHGSYQGLEKKFRCIHDTVNHGVREYVRGEVHTNSIESVWAVFKRGYHGTYHHWAPKNTNRYGKEFAFRLSYPALGKAMDTMVDGAIGKRLTYEDLKDW